MTSAPVERILASGPGADGSGSEGDSVLVRASGLSKSYPVRRGIFRSVDHWIQVLQPTDLEIHRGEIVGLVGESGSGKTTLGRLLTRLLAPSSGEVRFGGVDLLGLEGANLRRARKDFQMIFQDPYGSLNPRMKVGDLIGEPLMVHGLKAGASAPRSARRQEVLRWLDRVGLPASSIDKYPHEFSGGQRQRVGIARALACEPKFVVADEPVSALDVSVQAQIVRLLVELKQELDLTMLFISHDLSVVREIADRLVVLYLGGIVEQGPTQALYNSPLHPYTASLLSSVSMVQPEKRRERIVLFGEVPSPAERPAGCAFHPRCPIAEPRCRSEEPALEPHGGSSVACHFPSGLPLAGRKQ